MRRISQARDFIGEIFMKTTGKPRVMVTGLGAITPLGLNWPLTWQGMLEGRSGINPITGFDPRPFRCRIAGEVSGFDAKKYMNEKTAERMERYAQFAIAASREALAHANLLEQRGDPERVAVIIGTGMGGLREVEQQQLRLMERGPRGLSPLGILRSIGNTACGQIAIEHGFQGPTFCPATACASGAHALALALDLLRSGRADVALAGGSEAVITPLGIGEFCAIQALSQRNDAPQGASRPFDCGRDGFIMGEGCGIAVLETEDHARKRGARILAEFRGAGMSTDAHHLTCPHPEARGYSQAMARALQDAELSCTDIEYINAHGTSTRLCDALEAAAVRKTFDSHCNLLKISSTKSMTGHLIGGAGGLEFAVIVQSTIEQKCPPTINLEHACPECEGMDLVPKYTKSAAIKAALSNSFGFGGHNVSLAVGAA